MTKLPDGWLTGDEAEQLRSLSTGLVVLELGAWKGRSTVALAENASLVISVDHHHGMREQDSLPDYLDNVRAIENVVMVIGAFDVVLPHLQVIDLVYIDGDHEAESVRQDIGLALAIGPQTVAFHDWDFPQVKAAAEEELGREADGVVGSVAWYQL